MVLIGVCQSFGCGCLNICMVGYHGVLFRSSSQRQLGGVGSSSQVFLPSAPARCVFVLSMVMIWSQAAICAVAAFRSLSGLMVGSW